MLHQLLKDVVRRACIVGFNMKGFDCNLLENLNGTIFVRFIHKQCTIDDLNGDSDDEDWKSMPRQFHWPTEKRCKTSHSKQLNSQRLKSKDPTPNLRKSFPHSLSIVSGYNAENGKAD